MKKIKAFTLAEVLVTLGIIGVVSAMTVPTLMQNYQKKSYVTQLHKVYNELQQSIVQLMTDKNAVNLKEAGINSTAAAQNFIKSYFKIVSTCENSLKPCFADSYRILDGNAYGIDGHINTSYVLASGTSIRPLYAVEGSAGKIVNILVDVNGQQGPNILGRDTFYIAIYNNGALDAYSASATSVPLTEAQRDAAGSEWGPFGKILNDNWEMNY